MAKSLPKPDARPLNLAAVIDIGTSAVRMTIAEVSNGNIRILDFLQQAVSLGKDTFTDGAIQKERTEECVRVLRSFRRAIDEFGITDPKRIRAVATTAVREAENRQAFLDRLYMATGFQIEVLEEADTTRLTYLSVLPHIKADKALADSPVLVTEVGGGNTEILLLHKQNVLLSHDYRLGSLRMRQMLDTFHSPVIHQREVIINHIERTMDQIRGQITRCANLQMVAIGGDARFAASRIQPEHDLEKPVRIHVGQLLQFTDSILSLSVNEIERKYHISFPEAETVGLSLLVYLCLARTFKLKEIIVSPINMRHGLLLEIAGGAVWTDEFREKILWSAIETVRKFHADEKHALHVADLSRTIFRSLQAEHQLGPHHEFLLQVAALVHDVGLFISSSNHHKHSMYLIQNSDIFGLSRHDLLLVSLIARYHRRAVPKVTHVEYMNLDRDTRLVIAKLAAILRTADALDVSHSQRVHKITCRLDRARCTITAPDVDDLSLEQIAVRQKGPMFEDVYGASVVLRKSPSR